MSFILLKPFLISLFFTSSINGTPTEEIIIEKTKIIEHNTNSFLTSKKMNVKYKTTAAGWTFIAD